jgi:predicted alpha/beta-hydrolase family hydrolase
VNLKTTIAPVQKYGNGDINVVFAHGSGIGMNHAFMQAVASALSEKNFSVYLFEFSYMQTMQATGIRRPPIGVAKLQLEYLALLDALALEGPVVIGGKSLGGRVASLIAEQSNALGWFALGYPFHPQRKPENLRVAHLLTSHKPGLIVQGTRDALGHHDEVLSYRLPSNIQLHWLLEMDHSFVPYKASKLSQQEAIIEAVDCIDQWVKHTLN